MKKVSKSYFEVERLRSKVSMEQFEELPLFDQAVAMGENLQVSLSEMEHLSNEQLRDMITEHMQINAEEHRRMDSEMKELRKAVSACTTSMEVLSMISMEGLDEHGVEMANVALGAIGRQVDVPAPTLEMERGEVTQVSMEGILDFIAGIFRKLGKWISEKFKALQTWNLRNTRTEAAIRQRLDNVQKRMDELGDNPTAPNFTSIPADPRLSNALFYGRKPISTDPKTLAAATKEALAIASIGPVNIVPDIIKRSTAASEGLNTIITSPNGNLAYERAQTLFKTLSKEWPTKKVVPYNKDVPGGMLYKDGADRYVNRHRDLEWIAAVVSLIECPQVISMSRTRGENRMNLLNWTEMKAVVDACTEIVHGETLHNDSWHSDLSMAWRDASNAYNVAVGVVNGTELPHMDRELWRAVDIAAIAMFEFLEKAFRQTSALQQSAWGYVVGLLYQAEESLNAYHAV